MHQRERNPLDADAEQSTFSNRRFADDDPDGDLLQSDVFNGNSKFLKMPTFHGSRLVYSNTMASSSRDGGNGTYSNLRMHSHTGAEEELVIEVHNSLPLRRPNAGGVDVGTSATDVPGGPSPSPASSYVHGSRATVARGRLSYHSCWSSCS